MTDINITKRVNRQRRHARIRAVISGTADRPRVSVFKSNKYVYVQAIDDVAGTTIAAVNAADLKGKGAKSEKALEAGKKLADLLKAKKVSVVVFDKGGFTFHGRVKAIADGLRENGIKV